MSNILRETETLAFTFEFTWLSLLSLLDTPTSAGVALFVAVTLECNVVHGKDAKKCNARTLFLILFDMLPGSLLLTMYHRLLVQRKPVAGATAEVSGRLSQSMLALPRQRH